jgi:hypothetical protein
MSKIILNTPCMPKSSYHVGNAISQIVTDVLVAFHRVTDPRQDYIYVNHAWNMHGLPFERLYTETVGHPGTYHDIQIFAEQHVEAAIQEKAYFVDYGTRKSNITYIDTDPIGKEFCAHCFHQLAEQGYVEEQQGECYLNLEKFFTSEREAWLATVQEMHVYPSYHQTGIVANQQTLGGLFPLTKRQRVFVPSVIYRKTSYALNPVVQSLVYPCYIAARFQTTMPTLLQASASGHGMLKWHYLRTIISYLLTKTIPYHHLLLHGTVLGEDGTPMSKHKQNSIRPSDLYQRRTDLSFVRYVLLKSLSHKDVPLQLQAAEREYLRIAQKGTLLRSGYFQLHNEQDVTPFLARSLTLLEGYQVKHAFEHLYLALKKAQVQPSPVENSGHLIAQLYGIFLNAERDLP